jgi:hypothetical protein
MCATTVKPILQQNRSYHLQLQCLCRALQDAEGFYAYLWAWQISAMRAWKRLHEPSDTNTSVFDPRLLSISLRLYHVHRLLSIARYYLLSPRDEASQSPEFIHTYLHTIRTMRPRRRLRRRSTHPGVAQMHRALQGPTPSRKCLPSSRSATQTTSRLPRGLRPPPPRPSRPACPRIGNGSLPVGTSHVQPGSPRTQTRRGA